jgi:hypothetical protein
MYEDATTHVGVALETRFFFMHSLEGSSKSFNLSFRWLSFQYSDRCALNYSIVITARNLTLPFNIASVDGSD